MHDLTKNAPTTPPALAAKMTDKSIFRIVIKGDNDGVIPISVGMELFGDMSGDGPRDDFRFEWGVGLAEPGVVTHLNVVTALRDYHSAVEKVVTDLKGYLRDTP